MPKRYPTYSKELKFSNGLAIHIDATVEMDRGRPVVALHSYNGEHDDRCFTVVEAERLGKAWLAAAKACRGKLAYAKAQRKARK